MLCLVLSTLSVCGTILACCGIIDSIKNDFFLQRYAETQHHSDRSGCHTWTSCLVFCKTRGEADALSDSAQLALGAVPTKGTP